MHISKSCMHLQLYKILIISDLLFTVILPHLNRTCWADVDDNVSDTFTLSQVALVGSKRHRDLVSWTTVCHDFSFELKVVALTMTGTQRGWAQNNVNPKKETRKKKLSYISVTMSTELE